MPQTQYIFIISNTNWTPIKLDDSAEFFESS